MVIDLHTHSAASDGTQSPTVLVRAAAEAGLGVIGLTDHDTTAGWDEADAAGRDAGVAVVPGMEISCRWQGISVHLLSYLHDPGDTELRAEVTHARELRASRARTITERISEDYPITWDDVLAEVEPGATIGRPHIADALVRAGVVPNRSAAFDDVLHRRASYYVSLPVVDPVRAIRMVADAGGVSVFAHPAAASRGRTVGAEGMRAIIEAGLDGLEVYHRDNSPASQRLLAERAARHGLITTGSSDYHGAGKPNWLGEHSTPPEMYERILAAGWGSALLGAQDS